MISFLSIKNFAIVEDAEISFNKGLNVMTGESGSGKSIIVEAMSLALGSRADSSYIRTGADKAVIQMVAEYLNKEYVITREITGNGKNLCKINGEIVSLNQLHQLACKIADIHGQYDNQSLLNSSLHLELVDKYESAAITPYKNKVAELYQSYKNILIKVAEHKEKAQKYFSQKEFMEYQLSEIRCAHLKPGEDKDLVEKLIEEQNREKIFTAFQKAYSLCNNDENSMLSQIDKIQSALREISDLSRDASDLEDEFSDAYYRLEDTMRKTRKVVDSLVYSEEDIDGINDRLDTINSLKKKYGDTIEDILLFADKLSVDIQKIDRFDSDIGSLKIEQERTGEMLKAATEALSNLRKRSAATLESKIQNELKDLNFNNSKVSIEIQSMNKYTSNGIDKVEFMISTNLGEPLKPLSKIASGGEMARIMLAFKNIIGEYDGIGTMIFDEIDSGISGQAATTVGKKLLEVSNKHQIIAITHLPQIAALGNHNYKIVKKTLGFTTTTNVIHLSEKEKIIEIARLLSGDAVTDIAIENAKALIK